MELRTLGYFLTVAREGNITRAAGLLHLTQPTLSRQLKQLEEEVGAPLFQRGGHKLTLTAQGQLLLRRAQEIVSLAQRAKEELRLREGDLAGRVFLGSGELRGSAFLAQMAADFHRAHPGVTFQLYSGNADNIRERIEQGLLDAALVPEPVDLGQYRYLRPPMRERWGALVLEGSPLAAKGALSPEDFLGVPLVVPQREAVLTDLANWFGPVWGQLDRVAGGNLQYNEAILAKALGGCVVTMELETRFSGMAFVPLSPALEVGTLLIWKNTQAFSQAAQAFLRFAESYVLGMEEAPK